MSEVASSSRPPSRKCRICRGRYTDCFLYSCMHEFCFTCILEWSKVNAECPVCKKPIKYVLNNIKSNGEYDKYFITPESTENSESLEGEESLPPTSPRCFTFRNTGTTGSEQQSSGSSSAMFRRSVYMQNQWVSVSPDVATQFEDITPDCFRKNPNARIVLDAWLNRELNALFPENTQQVMHLVDLIMDHLPRWHIKSTFFKELLSPYLTNHTEHFIHEFYHFMCSPYDMMEYDRHINYPDRPDCPTYLISDNEDDSDVMVGAVRPDADNNRSHKDYESRKKKKSKGKMKTIIISDSSSSDNELLLSRKRKIDFDSDDDQPLSKIKSKKPKNELKNNCSSSQTISSRTHTITSRNLLSTGEDNEPQNTTDDEDYCNNSNSEDENKIGEADYNSFYSGPSTSWGVKENTNTNHCFLNFNTSDSDTSDSDD